MRVKITQYGQFKTVVLITLVSVISSVLIYLSIGNFTREGIVFSGIIISIVVPAVITPSVSWYMIGMLIKIHHLEVEMRELATYDSLTKVMSRKAFLTNSEVLHQLIKRDQSSLAMLYIDIDNFKKINDTYGHSIGDEVLKSFGSILEKNKRESDIVSRLGGEEFAFVLPETNIKGAIQFSDNLRNTINNQCLEYDDLKIKYTVSIGVSVFDNNNQVNLDELTEQSDEALYIAKHSGKDCTIEYKANKSLEEERVTPASI